MEESAEDGSVLDEFLGLKTSGDEEREVIELRPLDGEYLESAAEMADASTGEREKEKADQIEKDFSAGNKTRDELKDKMQAGLEGEEMPVPGKAGAEGVDSAGSSDDHPEKDEESDAMDLGFDDLMADLVSEVEEEAVQPGDQSESGETVSLDEILGTDSGTEDKMHKDEVENNITESTLGELFDEEMGVAGFPESRTADEEDREETESDEYDEVLKEQRESESYEIEKTLALRFFESGLQYYQQAEYEQAVEEFEKSLVENPTFIKGYQCLGDAYFRMGKLDEARKAYERVKELDPDNINVLENLGVIFANRGDYKKAVWQWGEVLKRNPERKDIIDRIKKMQRVIRQRYL